MKKLIITIITFLIMVSIAWAYSCQYCGMETYFTGKTKVVWGKLTYQYKCPVGHVTWVAK